MERTSLGGAINRPVKAVERVEADFGVGLEGGTREYGGMVFNCGGVR